MRGSRPSAANRLQPRLTTEELRRKDAELARLVRMKPAMIVCLAECLAVFKERKWHWEMACGQLGDFVVEWCGQSKSWGDQHARLGLRLRELPKLRAAILRGEVPISQAMKLAAIVEGEDEDLWVPEVRGRSATAVGALLRAEPEAGENDEEGDDEDDDYVTWSCRATPLQLAWMRAAFMLIDAVAGVRLTRDEMVEAVIAEVLTTLLARVPEAGGFDSERQAAIADARRVNRIARYDAERRAEPSLPRPEVIEPVDIPIPGDLRGVFRLLRTMCQRLDGLDLEIGRRANEIWANDGWRRLRQPKPSAPAVPRPRPSWPRSSASSRPCTASRIRAPASRGNFLRRSIARAESSSGECAAASAIASTR